MASALPVYLEPSSPELSTLLSTLNSKVLLPRHLTKEQEKLVYKPENRAKLESEPIEITLGDVTLPLEHIDRNRDQPAFNSTWRDIIRASKTPEDWENVLRVMEGYANAGIQRSPAQFEMVVRNLSKAGMYHLILKALQRPDATGLRLRNWSVVGQVIRAVRERAWKADWNKDELKKALSMAEQVVQLMENDGHAAKTASTTDPRTQPAVVAVPLEMAAELAYRHDGDTEKVRRYAVRLMNALKQHDFLSAEIEEVKVRASRSEADYAKTLKQADALTQLANSLTSLIPVWNGLSTARTVLDTEMPMADEAERVQRQLRELLQQGEEALERLSIRQGKQIAKSGSDGYLGQVQDAIKKCEEDAEEE
ncbi:hypothetical protein N0V90_008772 [Kalmusia sp. IMI 367209]|nr:hypothetical protein N0V90_008772 [Kalmusia sp. IMI 367209]